MNKNDSNQLYIYDLYGFKFFPLNSDKSPATRGDWRAEENHLTMEQALQYQSIGGVIGAWIPEDVFVLDLDKHDGKPDGLKSMEDICKMYGIDPNFINKTFVVTTRSGGLHAIFTTNSTFKQNSKAPGIDLKNHKGYVVAAGSPGYEAKNDFEPIHIPQEIEAWLESCETGGTEIQEQAENILSESEIREIRSALSFLPSDDYDIWYRMGMALKSTGSPTAYGLFQEWSQKSEKYDPKRTENKWKDLNAREITIASLFHEAKQKGWVTTYEKNQGDLNFSVTANSKPGKNKKQEIPEWVKDFGASISKSMLEELETAPAPESAGHCDFLNIDYPPSGIVFSVFRTGYGKSTTKANQARELLQQGKSVVYLSIEEPFPAVFSRLSQSCGYELAHKEGVNSIDFSNDSWLGRFNAFRVSDPWIKKGAEIVKQFILDGQLKIIDSTVKDSPRNLSSFYAVLKENKGRHIIILDYIQLLNLGGKRGFEAWADVAGDIINAATEGKTLLLAAAQLNRLGTEKSDTAKDYDPIAENMRESASLEQLASLIIGGGEKDGFHFYKILKDRYGQIGTGKYLMNPTPVDWMKKQYLFPATQDWGFGKTPAEDFIEAQNLKAKKKQAGGIIISESTPPKIY